MVVRMVGRPPAGSPVSAPTTVQSYRGGRSRFNVKAKVGTFNSPTVTGSQAITGFGFQPKIVLPFTSYQTTSAATTFASLSLGCADGDTQAAAGAYSSDSVTTSSTGRRHTGSRIISHQPSVSSGQPFLDATRTSFDADGITLNWAIVDISARILNYIALGGDIEANLVQCQMNNTNAAESFAHGLSGEPTAIFLFSGMQATAPPNATTNLFMSIGAWAGGNQFGASIYSNNGVTTTVARRLLSTSHALARITTSIQRSLAVSSVDATNVNVTYPDTTSTSQDYFWMLCLRNCRAQVGTFDCNFSLDPLTIPCAGIRPKLFLPLLMYDYGNGVIGDSVFFHLGASDGTYSASCGITDRTALTTTKTRRSQSSGIISEYNDDGAIRFRANVSFDNQSVVIDPTEYTLIGYGRGGYLIIGE